MSSEDKKLWSFELSVIDRLSLQAILKQHKSPRVETEIVEALIKSIAITEEEHEEYEIKEDDFGRTLMSPIKAKLTKTFSFTPWRMKKIVDVLNTLESTPANAGGGINVDLLPLYKMFIPVPTSIPGELAEEYAALALQKEADKVVDNVLNMPKKDG